MTRTVKWIVGVVIIVAIVAAGVWAWQNRAQLMANARPYAAQPAQPGTPNQQPFPYGPRGFENDGRNPMGGWGYGPMMGGHARFGNTGRFGMGFFFLGGLFRLLFPLVLLAIVAIIFYQFGRRSRPSVVRHESTTMPPPSDPKAPKSD